MHIGLNAQEALVSWSHSVLSPIWLAGFPDAPFPQFHIRPIRRVAILSFVVLAWRDVRAEIIQLSQSKKLTTTRQCFLDVLIWLFEEVGQEELQEKIHH